MVKIYRVLVILIIFSMFVINVSYAETTNLRNYVSNEEEIESAFEDSVENVENSTSNTSSSYKTSGNSATVSSVSTISEANLSLNNIVCIILIAIGILLILLAIAILVKISQ